MVIDGKSWDDASYDLGLTRREIAVRRKRALLDLVRCYQKERPGSRQKSWPKKSSLLMEGCFFHGIMRKYRKL